MKVIVTGGSGFIGCNLIKQILSDNDSSVVNIDKLTYAGNPESLADIEDNPNYKFYNQDIADLNSMKEIVIKESPDAIMHLAAESHVDRSIDNPFSFLETNIMGTYSLLEASREYLKSFNSADINRFRFHHISTDEVFGSLEMNSKKFNEITPYSPNSPYSASKASSDHLVRAWEETYEIPCLITNCSNNYGPFQHPEKLIPNTILSAINHYPITVYGDGQNIRDWLYVKDHVDALWKVLRSGQIGETYCIGGNNEISNLEVVELICEVLQEIHPIRDSKVKTYKDLINFVQDRPGHDLRYAIDTKKISKDLNWLPQEDFVSGIKKTVEWYISNLSWCSVVAGDSFKHRLGLNQST